MSQRKPTEMESPRNLTVPFVSDRWQREYCTWRCSPAAFGFRWKSSARKKNFCNTFEAGFKKLSPKKLCYISKVLKRSVRNQTKSLIHIFAPFIEKLTPRYTVDDEKSQWPTESRRASRAKFKEYGVFRKNKKLIRGWTSIGCAQTVKKPKGTSVAVYLGSWYKVGTT